MNFTEQQLNELKSIRFVNELNSIRFDADKAYERHLKLKPNSSDIPVGGLHIDELALYEALSTLLRNLGDKPLDVAIALAKDAARYTFQRWNGSRKDHQVHRWENSLDDRLNTYYRRLKVLL